MTWQEPPPLAELSWAGFFGSLGVWFFVLLALVSGIAAVVSAMRFRRKVLAECDERVKAVAVAQALTQLMQSSAAHETEIRRTRP